MHLLLFFWMMLVARDHNLHVSYSRAVVDGPLLVVRTAFFPDDFEAMLSQQAGRPVSGLQHNGDADSLFLAVVKAQARVLANGKPAAVRILQSGTEGDMCWYMVEYAAAGPVRTLEMDFRYLFSVFSDQKNMITLMDAATGRKDSFYGVEGASLWRWERK